MLIKHIPERGDILFGHNTWHEYRAMAFRILKSYHFNYRRLPGAEEIVPGNMISMSSYAGTVNEDNTEWRYLLVYVRIM